VSQDGNLPEIPDSSVDWVWSFDTFVHFHPELFDRYLREIARVLRPGGPGCKGGLLHLHYAVAWPGLEHNADCFQYRQPEQVADLAYTLGLHRTGRRVEYRSGFGSLLEEFRRVE
jgi:SAM-dependent methyltransferase